jgi:predicted metal-dependent phosphoesterase TrpH
MRVEFHTHTHHSYDCDMRPEKILQIAIDKKLDAIVINDHDTIKGGLECKKLNTNKNLEVIIGAEIKTDIGDITGIFLKEEIISRHYLDVITEIKNQGGLVILNHPFVGHKLNDVNFNGFDLIEGYNGRLNKGLNEKAVELAKKLNKPIVSGSDAHTYGEIGNCYTEFESSNFLLPSHCNYLPCSVFAPIRSQLIKARKRKDILLFTKILLGAPRKILGLK